jgi:hypothetical protein
VEQESLFTRAPRFDSGVDLSASDHIRLGAQIKRVLDALSDGCWHSVPEIARLTSDPEVSVSAQVRNLRKPKHGGYTIERRRVANVYEYRLVA